MMAKKSSQSHIYFIDNLRVFTLIHVLIFHLVFGLGIESAKFWFISDPSSRFYDYYLRFTDTFIMPVMFGIAGLFFYSSFKRGLWAFLKKKFGKLVIPYFIGITFITPLVLYIQRYVQVNSTLSYSDFFFKAYCTKFFYLWGKGAIDLQFWFASCLFLLFSFYALLFCIPWWKKIDDKIVEFFKERRPLVFSFFLSFLSIISYLVMNRFYHDYDRWHVMIFGFFKVQMPRLPLFFLFFYFAHIFSRANLFSKIDKFRFSKKKVLFSIIVILFLQVWNCWCRYKIYTTDDNYYLRPLSFILASMATCFFFFLFFYKYLNRENKIMQKLSYIGYGFYLIHFVVGIYFLELFSKTSIHHSLKFSGMLILSIGFSYLIAYLFSKIPILKKIY